MILSKVNPQKVATPVNDVGESEHTETAVSDASSVGAAIYDFKHPNRLTKDQLRNLRRIHEGFAKAVSTYLAGILKTNVEASLSSIDQVAFKEFTMAMSDIECIWLFDLENGEGHGIIEFSPPLVFMIIDKLFGGAGKPHKQIRAATVIEQNVIKRVISRILKLWDESWHKIYPVKTTLLSFETNPHIIQIAPLGDTVIVIFLELTVNKEVYPINICLPFFVMEPMIRTISNQGLTLTTHKKNKENQVLIEKVVKASEVPMVVQLGKTEISFEELLDLSEGDVIILEQKIGDEIKVLVGNNVRFFAKPGIVGKKKAIQITRIFE